MLDMKLLIIISSTTIIILAVSSSFFFYKYPEERYTKYFTLFSVFFLIGQVLTSSRNIIPDILSIIIGNMLLITGYIFLYIGIKALLNLEAKWHNRYFIPILVTLIGFILFTYVYYNVAMRIIIFSVFCVIYGSLVAWIFWKNATEKFKVIDYLSSLFFFIGAILFSYRTFRASTIEVPANYLSANDLMITLAYVYLFFIVIWITIIQIIHIMQRSSDEKIQNYKK